LLLGSVMAEHEPCIGASDEWYAPLETFTGLWLTFGLDSCSTGHRHWVLAKHVYLSRVEQAIKKRLVRSEQRTTVFAEFNVGGFCAPTVQHAPRCRVPWVRTGRRVSMKSGHAAAGLYGERKSPRNQETSTVKSNSTISL
jgi:hypothetical protein